MQFGAAQTLLPIVHQHVEESASLAHMRASLLRAPHVRLFQLRRLDERLVAHLDGIAVAGDAGWRICDAALATPGAGQVFTAAARAIEAADATRLDGILTLAASAPEAQAGALAAFTWASAQDLRGLIREMLASPDAFRRRAALVACSTHLADPGAALASMLADGDAPLRAGGLRAAGECGRADLLRTCQEALNDPDPDCVFWAARSAVLLGDRGAALRALQGVASVAGQHRPDALGLLLRLAAPSQAAALLKALSEEPADRRLLIRGAGIAGDSYFVPWLIGQMDDPATARLAGESFSTITGVDLASIDFERQQPEAASAWPNDDPGDDVVAMDEDDGLPWPDASKVQQWWSIHQGNFSAGSRCFMGAAPTRTHGLLVLRSGYQRQRIAAAQYLCLLQPGTKLFPTSAPAWRQSRWLDAMGG